MASVVVVRNDDESASLLDDDDDGGSPVSGGVSPPPLPGKAMRRPRHAVMSLIRSPFAAVLRMTTCGRDAAISTGDEQPSNGGDTAGVERRRGARRRPSLEQLLRMEAAPPPPPRPDRTSEQHTTAPSHDVVTTCTTVQQKRAQAPLSPSKGHHTVVVVSDDDDDERHAAAVPAVKPDAAGRRPTNAKRLVVVFASLRQCSRASGISVAMPSKDPNGKVAAAGGRAPGKAELFYYRPIPMGRRCRVQHLEESPYK
ncbi:uncharacterized protein C2845_PM08G09870 [Panicum miliaceum]|uniref:Uncharacterized protein n=1 Tax=Panicum miliaceum TaxID=4540 RepID=A0A3L6QX15_PANMI|nr:uncharacterized protein C2845_PM08G09870 [Panicum miliaceum]